MQTLTNTIVYLLGFSGTGKYTIACELARKTTLKLVDNHLINNPVFSLIQQDGITPLPPVVWEKTQAIRDVVLDTILTLSPPHFSFVFTNDASDKDPADHRLYKQVEDLAAARNSRYLPVRLICDEDELCRRIVSADRRTRMKCVNAQQLRSRLREDDVLKPAHPAAFTLDVTQLSAAQAADAILQKLPV